MSELHLPTVTREAVRPHTSADARPRVLFLDHSAALGGGELSLLDIATDWAPSSRVLLFEEGPFAGRLRENGVSVQVEPAARQVQTVSRKARGSTLLRALPAVTSLLRRLVKHARTADLLYANSQKSMVLAALAGRWVGVPVVWHLRDIITADHFSASNRWLVTRVANAFVTQIICNSKATRDAFVAAGGRPDRCTVIPNGIDPAPFEIVSRGDAHEIRRALGLEGVPLVGIFSRLSAWKGQDVLVDALKDLPDVHALVVGDALFPADEAYKAALHKQIQDADLSDRIHLLGFRDDIPTLMSAVDVVVHTSTAPEPFGRVIVEGLMAGRPVIASSAGGALEILQHEATGLLVLPNDPDALRNALASLFSDEDTLVRLSKAGQEMAYERFSLPTLLFHIDLLLRNCVASHRTGATTLPREP